MTNQIVVKKLPEETRNELVKIEEEYSGLATKDMPESERMLMLSDATLAIEQALTDDSVRFLSQLQGKEYGYCTDRDQNLSNAPTQEAKEKANYPVHALRSIYTNAIINGIRLVNNELAVIKGKCFAQKQFWKRKVQELTDNTCILDFDPSIEYERSNAEKTIKALIRWKAVMQCDGKTVKFPRAEENKEYNTISMNVYDASGGGADQAVGKAEARAYKYIAKNLNQALSHLTDISDEDIEFTSTKVVDNGNGELQAGRHSTGKTSNQNYDRSTQDSSSKATSIDEEAVKNSVPTKKEQLIKDCSDMMLMVEDCKTLGVTYRDSKNVVSISKLTVTQLEELYGILKSAMERWKKSQNN